MLSLLLYVLPLCAPGSVADGGEAALPVGALRPSDARWVSRVGPSFDCLLVVIAAMLLVLVLVLVLLVLLLVLFAGGSGVGAVGVVCCWCWWRCVLELNCVVC